MHAHLYPRKNNGRPGWVSCRAGVGGTVDDDDDNDDDDTGDGVNSDDGDTGDGGRDGEGVGSGVRG
jgi:hypothetical protein